MRPLAALLLVICLTACSAPDPPPPPPNSTILSPTTAGSSNGPTDEPSPRPTLTDLSAGPAPRIGYVEGLAHVAPDGTRTRIPADHGLGVLAIARAPDGFLVERDNNFEGYTTLQLVRDGRVVEEWSTTGPPVVGRDGEVAWGEATTSEATRQPPPAVHLSVDGVRRKQQQPLDRDPVAEGVIDGEAVVSQQFARGIEGETAQATDLISPPRDLPYQWVGDLDELHGRAVAQLNGARPGVVDLATGEELWRSSRQFEPVRFSPSGQLLFAAHRTGRPYALLDATTGAVRATFALPGGGYVQQAMWESDQALLAVVRQRHHAAVVRVGLDGRLTLALPVTTGNRDLSPGYALEQRA